jgi:hypothetical protein
VTSGYLVDTSRLAAVRGASDAALTASTPPPENWLPGALLPAARQRRLVLVEAGIKVRALCEWLDARKLSPKTLGGSAGQSIAGAISTGTHGGDDAPPIADMVKAIHLVTAGGRELWIERAADPLTDSAALAAAVPCLADGIIRDDDWFDSVLVSVGRMGIVYAFVVEVDPAYLLAKTVTLETWTTVQGNRPTDLRERLTGLAAQHAYTETIVVPYPDAGGKIPAYLTIRERRDPSTPVTPPSSDAGGTLYDLFCQIQDARKVLAGVSAFTAIGGLTAGAAISTAGIASAPFLDAIGLLVGIPPGVLGGTVAATTAVAGATVAATAATAAVTAATALAALAARGNVTAGDIIADVCNVAADLGRTDFVVELEQSLVKLVVQPTTTPVIGIPHEVMTGKHDKARCINVLAAEAAFDVANDAHLRFFDEVLDIFRDALPERLVFGGVVSIRFTRRTTAVLGMQQWARTCHFEFVPIKKMAGTRPLLDRIEAAATRHGGVMHWGQQNRRGAPDIQASFPRVETFRRVLVQVAAQGSVATFDNQFCQDHGLEPAGTAASTCRRLPRFQLTATRAADHAIWRPRDGNWWIRAAAGGPERIEQWGTEGDIPVPGSYLRAGVTDFAVWRPREGRWYIRGADGHTVTFDWGEPGDIPVPADFDGDGRTDLAVWRPRDGTWWVIHSSTGAPQPPVQWGTVGDIPLPGNYTSDRKADYVVWRPSEGNWYLRDGATLAARAPVQWGLRGDIPVPADYDGDGRLDFAVWRPSEGNWYVIHSGSGVPQPPVQWGWQGDAPVPMARPGGRGVDYAVWRPTEGTWYVKDGVTLVERPPVQWGEPGDVPL